MVFARVSLVYGMLGQKRFGIILMKNTVHRSNSPRFYSNTCLSSYENSNNCSPEFTWPFTLANNNIFLEYIFKIVLSVLRSFNFKSSLI